MRNLTIVTAAKKRDDAFWRKMSRDQQVQYLKDHPNTKYKGFTLKPKNTKDKKVEDTKPASPLSPDANKPKKKLTDVIKDWHKEQKEFFHKEQHKPESKERSKLAELLSRKTKGLGKAIKGEVKEWKIATGALRKIKNGEELDDHDKKAMKAVALHSGIVIADVAISGGMANSIATAIGELTGGMLSHSLVVNFSRAAIYASESFDESDDELLDELIGYIIQGVKSAPIPANDWVKAFEGVNRNEKSKK